MTKTEHDALACETARNFCALCAKKYPEMTDEDWVGLLEWASESAPALAEAERATEAALGEAYAGTLEEYRTALLAYYKTLLAITRAYNDRPAIALPVAAAMSMAVAQKAPMQARLL